jgi:DtxR family Mn-dependent transcriptional regulator
MSADQLSRAVQDYLKAIYALDAAGVRVTTSALAERMDVSAPSATGMMKRLAELGLAERSPYRGVVLTEAGRRSALEVLRHHRLLERYLVDTLGLPLDRVHAEADRLEHALRGARSPHRRGTRFSTHDPHGRPSRTGAQDRQACGARALDLSPGDRATVTACPIPTTTSPVPEHWLSHRASRSS